MCRHGWPWFPHWTGREKSRVLKPMRPGPGSSLGSLSESLSGPELQQGAETMINKPFSRTIQLLGSKPGKTPYAWGDGGDGDHPRRWNWHVFGRVRGFHGFKVKDKVKLKSA
jgi:hypothetical protein